MPLSLEHNTSPDLKPSSTLVSNPNIFSQSDAQRIQKLTTTPAPSSDLFLDAYNLVAKTAEEHPYLATAAAGTAIVGAGLIAHNYGTIARSIGRFTQSTVSEARVAFASLSRETTVAAEKPALQALQLSKPSAIGIEIDKLVATNSRTLGADLRSGASAERNFDFSLASGTNLRSENQLLGKTISFSHEHDHLKPAHVTSAENFMEANSSPLKVLAHESFSAPKSMSPRAYKVLRDDGSAPFDSRTTYPLPSQTTDGQVIPGAWVEPGESAGVKMIQQIIDGGVGQEQGIYITSNPRMWYGGSKGYSVFEVEIGDSKSLQKWEQAFDVARIDTVASRVRLLRRVPDEEVAKIPIRPEDYLGKGFNNLTPDFLKRFERSQQALMKARLSDIMK